MVLHKELLYLFKLSLVSYLRDKFALKIPIDDRKLIRPLKELLLYAGLKVPPEVVAVVAL